MEGADVFMEVHRVSKFENNFRAFSTAAFISAVSPAIKTHSNQQKISSPRFQIWPVAKFFFFSSLASPTSVICWWEGEWRDNSLGILTHLSSIWFATFFALWICSFPSMPDCWQENWSHWTDAYEVGPWTLFFFLTSEWSKFCRDAEQA